MYFIRLKFYMLIVSVISFQARSSEVIYSDEIAPQLRASTPIQKTTCVPAPLLGIKGCFELTSTSAVLNKNAPLLNLIGQHAVFMAVRPGKDKLFHYFQL